MVTPGVLAPEGVSPAGQEPEENEAQGEDITRLLYLDPCMHR